MSSVCESINYKVIEFIVQDAFFNEFFTHNLVEVLCNLKGNKCDLSEEQAFEKIFSMLHGHDDNSYLDALNSIFTKISNLMKLKPSLVIPSFSDSNFQEAIKGEGANNGENI